MTLDLEGYGAGEGNRTLVVSLGSFCSAIELHPRFERFCLVPQPATRETPHRCHGEAVAVNTAA